MWVERKASSACDTGEMLVDETVLNSWSTVPEFEVINRVYRFGDVGH